MDGSKRPSAAPPDLEDCGACLGDETLVALASGDSATEERERALTHVDRCGYCRGLLAEIFKVGDYSAPVAESSFTPSGDNTVETGSSAGQTIPSGTCAGRQVVIPRLRFADRALERAFLSEYAKLDRWRYLLFWGPGIPVAVAMRFSLLGTPDEIRLQTHIDDLVVIPAVLAALVFGMVPAAAFTSRWQFCQLALTLVVEGAVAATALIWAGAGSRAPSPVFVEFGAAMMCILIVATFTVSNLRLGQAALVNVVSAASLQTATILELLRERLPLGTFLNGSYFLVSGLVLGGVGGYQIERLRRAEFLRRHELAQERAKTERLLKREIGHQVAARSKQLGAELARLDRPADGAILAPGDRFDARYRVVQALGAGGMGAVYEVERLTDAQRFALKIMTGRVSGAVAARFAREAEIGARLHHPNLVSILDVGVSPSGAPFLVMELVCGGSLEDQRLRFGDPTWARPLLRQVADGLVALHDAGVVHRDLKPGNILLQGDDTPIAKISDFGLSRFGAIEGAIDVAAATVQASPPGIAERLTGTGALLGTPLYMAPESADGARAADRRSDVFAFGILAYEMLTARLPFKLPPLILALAKQPLPVPDPMPVADAVSRCMLDCLVEDPALRPTMRQVRTALETE
jgi:Protein kinase domain